jgi:hypothetical protein
VSEDPEEKRVVAQARIRASSAAYLDAMAAEHGDGWTRSDALRALLALGRAARDAGWKPSRTRVEEPGFAERHAGLQKRR